MGRTARKPGNRSGFALCPRLTPSVSGGVRIGGGSRTAHQLPLAWVFQLQAGVHALHAGDGSHGLVDIENNWGRLAVGICRVEACLDREELLRWLVLMTTCVLRTTRYIRRIRW